MYYNYYTRVRLCWEIFPLSECPLLSCIHYVNYSLSGHVSIVGGERLVPWSGCDGYSVWHVSVGVHWHC